MQDLVLIVKGAVTLIRIGKGAKEEKKTTQRNLFDLDALKSELIEARKEIDALKAANNDAAYLLKEAASGIQEASILMNDLKGQIEDLILVAGYVEWRSLFADLQSTRHS